MSALSEQECQNELLKNIDLNISTVVENKVEPPSNECWTRCLKHLPVFALKDINLYCSLSAKGKNTVISKRLKEKENLKTKATCVQSSIFTKCKKNTFKIKAKYSASMKNIKRDVAVTLTRKTSRVEQAKCNGQAGASSYCNHVCVCACVCVCVCVCVYAHPP